MTICKIDNSQITQAQLSKNRNIETDKLLMVWFMVYNVTFNNISVILWQSVLVVEETRVPGENHQSADKLYHIMLLSTPRLSRIQTLVVIGTDCIGSCKSKYHMITTTMAPKILLKVAINTITLT